MTTIEFSQQLINLKDRLSHFALGLTLNKDDANDLLQETMFKAITNRNQFDDYSNLKAWTFIIMKNTFINNYRKKILQNAVFEGTEGSYLIRQNSCITNNSYDSILSVHEITKVIDSLDKEYQISFKMHVEGFKYKEIANILGLNLGTVKSRIFFTRKKLMDNLKG